MKFKLFRRGPRMVRCYDCGLDYASKSNPACPRCGETRVIPRSAPFDVSPGTGWKLFGGVGPNAAGHAAAELRNQGNDAMWRADNPEREWQPRSGIRLDQTPTARINAMDLPLFEDDLHESAVIEPGEVIDAIDMPECLVLCFFNEVVDAISSREDARRVEVLVAAHGEHPIYEIEHRGQRLAVLHPGVGAPLAAGFMEEAIALGCRTVVAVGAAGALDPDLVLGHAVIVESAVRDEGTSFHYLAPSRVVDADPAGIAALQQTLESAGVPFVSGRTWTTDAMYRETRGRVARRVAEGCVTVEMEASAFIAVARFRGVSFAQLLYAGDSLSGPVWDARDWTSATSVRERLFWHAADACLTLAGGRSESAG